jgi:8-oxo-dGTP pyrophosphatase MutT (NUDIX family)
MRTIHRDIVGALIFSKDGKLFHARGTDKGVYPDCWKIPGGGIEEGESKEDALRREVMEETGIDITPYQIELVEDAATGESEKTLKETGERVLVQMNFYTYRIIIADKNADEISIVLDDEFTRYEWHSLEQLKTVKITPPSEGILKKLRYIS